jgi:hypothetical protein
MFARVFTPLGITRADLTWRRNAYRPRTFLGVARCEFGSGMPSLTGNLGPMSLSSKRTDS